jgi:hypothetical protein
MSLPMEVLLIGLAVAASIVAVGFAFLIVVMTWALMRGWAGAQRVASTLAPVDVRS